MKKIFLIGFGLLLTVAACDTNPNLNNCDFDESAMLTNYADEIIIPRFQLLKIGVAHLNGAIVAFDADPTIGSLNEARIAFGAAYSAYQKCSSFGFGPGLINGVPFRERFNTFPTSVSLVESNVSGGVSVAQSSKSAVGFPALDYLLFADGITDQEIVDAFVVGNDAAARKQYLQLLGEELLDIVNNIETGWSTYRSSFVSNTGTAAGSSISLLTNELNFDFEILKNFKFKIPLGKLNGGVVLPQNVEAVYAGGGAELAVLQAQGLRDLFLGVGANQSDGSGLYEYLVCLDTKSGDDLLADVIRDRFNTIITSLNQIPDPLSETLVNDKPVVDAAYTEMQMMVPLIKHDMTSALGVQISYQDNDGD